MTWTNIDLHYMGSRGIPLGAILQEVHNKWSLAMSLKITHWKSQQHPSGIQPELTIQWIDFFASLSPSNKYQCISPRGKIETDICSS